MYIKPIVIIFIGLIIFWNVPRTSGQVLFSTPYESEADLKVFLVKTITQADLLVYRVDNSIQATGDGLWYLTDIRTKAKKKIYFVNTVTKADLRIYYVDNLSQRGWRNLAKKYLLEF